MNPTPDYGQIVAAGMTLIRATHCLQQAKDIADSGLAPIKSAELRLEAMGLISSILAYPNLEKVPFEFVVRFFLAAVDAVDFPPRDDRALRAEVENRVLAIMLDAHVSEDEAARMARSEFLHRIASSTPESVTLLELFTLVRKVRLASSPREADSST